MGTLKTLSRKDFISLVGALGAGAVLPFGCQNLSSTRFGVVVIGAGLAGLSAGLELKKHNIDFKIFEGQGRIGGRVLTTRDFLYSGHSVDLGGEFIGAEHSNMLSLCKRYNLPLQDRYDSKGEFSRKICWEVDGRKYSEQEVISQLSYYFPLIKSDLEKMGENISAKDYNPHAYYLDHLSIDQYFDKIGISGWFRKLLVSIFKNSMGISTADQTAINFLWFMHEGLLEKFELLDEQYRIIGGTDLLVSSMAKEIQGKIETEKILEAVIEKKSGEYELVFKGGQSVIAKKVIITIPFSVLKNVDFKVNGFSEKQKIINSLKYAQHSKHLLGFEEPLWRQRGFSGEVWTNNPYECSWEHTSGVDKMPESGITIFTSMPCGMQDSINQFSKTFPGVKYTKGFVYDWSQNRFSNGSYSVYSVGDCTLFAGKEGLPVGGIHFAGEHTSLDYQSYMEGAVETGIRAAKEALNS